MLFNVSLSWPDVWDLSPPGRGNYRWPVSLVTIWSTSHPCRYIFTLCRSLSMSYSETNKILKYIIRVEWQITPRSLTTPSFLRGVFCFVFFASFVIMVSQIKRIIRKHTLSMILFYINDIFVLKMSK